MTSELTVSLACAAECTTVHVRTDGRSGSMDVSRSTYFMARDTAQELRALGLLGADDQLTPDGRAQGLALAARFRAELDQIAARQRRRFRD
ncbi:hypothetical protein GUY44_11835 [Pimelobacter simplex]|uniref:hypothetical protein n=1 Tax=Nocardioides simplex TaxID=2045 RepID=UPI001144EABE|nr:hypothetical protein [Pimelobacter simplex]MCG8151172.1 hypothetical protein [Pimelobacter simplex]GEB17236.1 hypothetical protein NSI01_55510 [Pimelobacter simplex]